MFVCRPAQGRAEDREDLYSVDFLKKGYLETEIRDSEKNRGSRRDDEVYGVRLDSRMQSEDMKRESERVEWEAEQAKAIAAEASEQERRRKNKEVINEVRGGCWICCCPHDFLKQPKLGLCDFSWLLKRKLGETKHLA